MSEKALLVPVNGIPSVAEFEKEKSYDFLSETVGGYVEMVMLGKGIFGVVNEEGKIQDPPLPQNHDATLIARLNQGISFEDYIAGPMVVVGMDSEGETIGLPDSLLNQIITILLA